MTFRFDHKGTRDKISYWFAGKVDSSWKAEYTKCEEFMEKLGHSGANFAKKWSQTTTLPIRLDMPPTTPSTALCCGLRCRLAL
jgi:hypothetical protein